MKLIEQSIVETFFFAISFCDCVILQTYMSRALYSHRNAVLKNEFHSLNKTTRNSNDKRRKYRSHKSRCFAYHSAEWNGSRRMVINSNEVDGESHSTDIER